MSHHAYTVLWNPHAGLACQMLEVRKRIESLSNVKLEETISGEQTRQLASEVVAREAEGNACVVAAGGDGTVNAVINGLCEHPRRPMLGILPLGTGNDLCRALDIPLAPEQAAELIFQPGVPRRTIDLASMQSHQRASRFANVSSGGNSQRVAECLDEEMKRRWGAWSYLRGSLQLVSELSGFDVTLRVDDQPAEQLRLWNVIVANGRMAAGGLPVAPEADLQDGLLDLILIRDGTPLDMASLSVEFFMGNYLEDERVLFRRASRIEIESDPPMQFLADGEIEATTPLTFALEQHALEVIAPPG